MNVAVLIGFIDDDMQNSTIKLTGSPIDNKFGDHRQKYSARMSCQEPGPKVKHETPQRWVLGWIKSSSTGAQNRRQDYISCAIQIITILLPPARRAIIIQAYPSSSELARHYLSKIRSLRFAYELMRNKDNERAARFALAG